MPKSKRAKVVHLSKVEKKGKEITLKLYAAVQECANKYPYLYVFAVDNMRNTYLKDVRVQLSDSRSVFLTISIHMSTTRKRLKLILHSQIILRQNESNGKSPRRGRLY